MSSTVGSTGLSFPWERRLPACIKSGQDVRAPSEDDFSRAKKKPGSILLSHS